jgi:DNA-binding NarL/FixJ family response regulator
VMFRAAASSPMRMMSMQSGHAVGGEALPLPFAAVRTARRTPDRRGARPSRPASGVSMVVATLRIRARYPAVGVLVLSQFVEPHYALQLIDNAEQRAGYLLKDRVGNIEELADAVRQIAAGRLIIDPALVSQLLNRSRRRDPLDALTDREKAVLALMAQGRSNHAIANRLFVTEKTVEAHIRAIFIKLNLSPTAEDHRRVLAVITYLWDE